MPHDSGDAPFRHYTTKHRVISWISRNLFDGVTYTVQHGLNRGMRRKGGLGWLPSFLAGSAPSAEQVFWEKLDLSGLTIYDIGAFHGLLTMFFARRGRQVVSYEPNTTNHKRLLENIRLNKLQNVTVRKIGLGASAGTATMVTSPLMLGGASIEPQMIAGLRNSNVAPVTEEIPVTTLDEDIRTMTLPPPQFIKIDVEGYEAPVLAGARETLLLHKPALFLEMHGETMNLKIKNVHEIVSLLDGIGYRDIQHIETGSAIGVDNAPVAAEGHLYCRWNG